MTVRFCTEQIFIPVKICSGSTFEFNTTMPKISQKSSAGTLIDMDAESDCK